MDGFERIEGSSKAQNFKCWLKDPDDNQDSEWPIDALQTALRELSEFTAALGKQRLPLPSLQTSAFIYLSCI